MTLYEINNQLEELMENAVDTETGEINEDIVGQLEELEMAKSEKIENIGLFIKNLTADAEALQKEKMAFAKRQKMAESKAEYLKKYLAFVLGGEKYVSTKVSVSFRTSSSVEITDLSRVPKEYLKYAEPEVDKTYAKEMLKSGKEIDGLALVERKSVQIK